MRKTLIMLICLSFPLSAFAAASVEKPVVKTGDSWVYKTTIEKGQSGWTEEHDEYRVVHAGKTSILRR